MVLWELALGTAYFLGIRRTYRLALKTQRRLVSPKHPRIRDFMHRFDWKYVSLYMNWPLQLMKLLCY
ncbi:hypothetical protein AtNW77_Chr2g0256261 [Arabidopsis thaliana]